ncbi:hypothetical protein [Corynebacterium yudongzhengii]|uniref:hypothetical protein n=1 Tax=Corynebacterium yudongzhengii TaxID=2080740 RepID=UPI00131F1758|nr:hypothetical protein [Corynebacterium yudongzhengii]
MQIDSENLGAAASVAAQLSDDSKLGQQKASSAAIGPSYSVASGFDQMGTMHGRFIKDGSGAAAQVLQDLSGELDDIHTNLNRTSEAFQAQDDTAAHALDIADHGGSTHTSSYNFSPLDATGTSGLGKTTVGVLPALSVQTLMHELQQTDGNAAYSSQRIWVEIINAAKDIASGLHDVSTTLGSENTGAVIDAIRARIDGTARRSEVIAANSRIINQYLGALDRSRMTKLGDVTGVKLELDALRALGPNGEMAARIAEHAFLGYYAAATQAELVGLIPPVSNLTLEDSGTSGGHADAMMSDVDGTGSRYSTNGIITPHGLRDQLLEAAAAYPESFERINSVTRGMADAAGVSLGEGLFSPQAISTDAATMTSPQQITGLASNPSASPTASLPGVSGASNVITPMGAPLAPSATTNYGGAQPSRPSTGATPSTTSPQARTSTPGATGAGVLMPGMASARPGIAGSAGSNPSAGTRFGSGFASTPSEGSRAIGATGSHNAQGGSSSTGLRGVSGVPPTPGHNPSNPGQPSGDDSTRRPNPGGNTNTGTNPHAQTATQGQNQTTRAGMAPMMGGVPGARNTNSPNNKGKIRTITSQVEREGNMRDLLGERPPVVPGVIGAWVREPRD